MACSLTGGLSGAHARKPWSPSPNSLAAVITTAFPAPHATSWSALLTPGEAQWIAQQLASGFPEESRSRCERRSLLSLTAGASPLAGGCAAPDPPATAATDAVQGTGDIGVVIDERAAGASP